MIETFGMDTEQIIEFAKQKTASWQWSAALNKVETYLFARENNLMLYWGQPIRPGDIYLVKDEKGWQLLTCRELGAGCVFNTDRSYPYDFAECVKVT